MDFPFVKEALGNLFKKSSCDMYPVVPREAPERYRGRIAYDASKCINCGMCERVCAGGAISRSSEPCEEGDKITMTFNMGSCTFCGMCADFCSRKAIELTADYHMAATSEEELLVSGTFIKKKPAPKPAPAAKPAAPAEAKPAEEAPACTVVPRDDGKPVCDLSKCLFCTLCAKKCPAGAIEVDRAAKTWTLDEEKCVACGTCADACRKNAIIM